MPHKHGSPIWNSIMKAKSALRDGFQFRVGNDESLFWYTPWTSYGNLCDHVIYVDIHEIDIKIKDLYFNNQWQLQQLYSDLPTCILEDI